MQLWRLCKQKHQNTAFSGDGGLYAPGRWHPKGFPIIYTASSLALATLEVFVHTESDKIPLVAIRAFIPDDAVIEEVDSKRLPLNWQDVAAYPALQQIGKKWLQTNQSPIWLSRHHGVKCSPLLHFGRTRFAPTLWEKSVNVGAQGLRPPIDKVCLSP